MALQPTTSNVAVALPLGLFSSTSPLEMVIVPNRHWAWAAEELLLLLHL